MISQTLVLAMSLGFHVERVSAFSFNVGYINMNSMMPLLHCGGVTRFDRGNQI